MTAQLQSGPVDPDSLQQAGLTEDELVSFVMKYRKAFQELDRRPPHRSQPASEVQAPARKREVGEREIGKGKGAEIEFRDAKKKSGERAEKQKLRDLFQAGTDRVSREYRDLVEQYYKSLAKE